MTKKLIPPDKKQCQAEITTHEPWRFGGGARQTKRCENKPTVIIRETRPGKDGQKGSMSLCPDCLKEIENVQDMYHFEVVPI